MKKPRVAHHPKASQPMPVVGVTWYTEQEWAKVKAAAADPERFEPTFAEWIAMAEDALTNLRKAGMFPVKVYVTADELLAWCLLYNKENDAEARAQFVLERNRAQHEAGA